jgi:hypothetical protein
LYESSYTVRLEFIEGGANELDYFFFDTVVPVEDTTWGVIKSMYRE